MSDKVMNLFSFEVRGFMGMFVNCCSVTCAQSVVQYQIRLFRDGVERPLNPLLVYLSNQSESVLNLLPRRSPAATTEIPLLDGAKVLDQILSSFEETQD